MQLAFEAVVASDGFVRSERSITLLDYVVGKSLAGQSESLKTYSIGLDVFDIGPDAEPEKSAVVRVEMGRLRKKLEHYYHTTGADDPVRIEIPKGNYRPLFIATKQEPVGVLAGKRRIFSTCAVVALLSLLIISFLLVRQEEPVKTNAGPHAPIVEIALFRNYSGLAKMDHMAAGLSFDIVSELARFSWLAVFVAKREKDVRLRGQKVETGKSQVKPDYVLSGNVNITNDRIVIAYRLIATDSQTVRWSKTFVRALTVKDIYAIQQETATAIAVEVGHPEGVVKRLEQARYRQMPSNLNSYVCTLMIYRYWRTFSNEDHLRTRQCLEAANAREPDYAESQAAVSFIYLDEVRYEKNRRKGYDPIERSLAAALRAVELDPFSTLAKQALFTVKLFKKDIEGFERVGNEAVGLAPNNPELLGDFGGKLALFAAKWHKGLNYSKLALKLNGDPAPWYFVAHGYKAVVDKDYQKGLKWAERMNAPKWFHYHLIRVISFAGLKDVSQLREAIGAFKEVGVNNQQDAIRRIESWGAHKSLLLILKTRLRSAYKLAEGES